MVSSRGVGRRHHLRADFRRKERADDLLEMILLVAEMQDLKANPIAWPRGPSWKPNWTEDADPWPPS